MRKLYQFSKFRRTIIAVGMLFAVNAVNSQEINELWVHDMSSVGTAVRNVVCVGSNEIAVTSLSLSSGSGKVEFYDSNGKKLDKEYDIDSFCRENNIGTTLEGGAVDPYTIGRGIAIDAVGNIVVNLAFPNTPSATNFVAIAPDGTMKHIACEVPELGEASRADFFDVAGDIFKNGYIATAMNQKNYVAVYNIFEGEQDKDYSYLVNADEGTAFNSETKVFFADKTVAEDAEYAPTMYAYNRSLGALRVAESGTKTFVNMGEPFDNGVATCSGSDAYVVKGVPFIVMPTPNAAGARGNAFKVVNVETGDIVAISQGIEEYGTNFGQDYSVWVNEDHSVNIAQLVLGKYLAMYSLDNVLRTKYEYNGITYQQISSIDGINIEVTGVKNISGELVIPSTITVDEKTYNVVGIKNKAFQDCNSLTSVVIPGSVTTIGSNAFKGCSNLTSVTLSEGVTTIGNSAFYNCKSLTNVELPSTITIIGSNAFSLDTYINNYYNLDRTIKCNAKTPPTLYLSAFYYNNITLEVPFASILAYKASENWTEIKNTYGSITYKNKDVRGIFYQPINETDVEVLSDTSKYVGNITLPAEITVEEKVYKVTTIGNSAFNGCTSLTSVVIPGSVTAIGDNAFNNCTGLADVTLSEGVTTIGNSAFNGCISLTSVIIPESVDVIGNEAFYRCSGLTNVTISEGVASIGSSAFSYCTSLSSLVIPASVIKIGSEAFYYCKEITSLSISEGVKEIGDNAFRGCSKLLGLLSLPSTITSIGSDAFDGAQYTVCHFTSATPPVAESTSLPETVIRLLVPDESISAYKADSIWGEYTLISESTSYIEINNVKEGNLGLSILEQANKNLPNIIGLNVHGKLGKTDLELINNNMKSLLFLDISDTDLAELPDEIFMDNPTLVSISLPKGLKKIGDYAFSGCSGLNNELVLPETLETIGKYAFYDCSNINGSLVIPENVTLIEMNAFMNCISVKSIDFSKAKDLTIINNNVFSGCTNLKSIILPESLTTIGNRAFNNCKKLENFTFPKTIEVIGMSAFSNCKNLTLLELSGCELLTTINSGTFSGCTSIETANLPSTITSIGDDAFANCEKLIHMSVPCETPPVIANNANVFYGVDYIACVLSIPSSGYVPYYLANEWGAFIDVENKSKIDVEVNKPEGEEDDDNNGCEIHYKKNEQDDNSGQQPVLAKSIRLLDGDDEIIETTVSADAVTASGHSLFVGYEESVTFYFTLEKGKVIEKVLYNGVDVTDQIVNNSYTATVTSETKANNFVVTLKNTLSAIIDDVNGDGVVDISDVTTLADYVAGKNVNGFHTDVADINNDGVIDNNDVVELINKITSK